MLTFKQRKRYNYDLTFIYLLLKQDETLSYALYDKHVIYVDNNSLSIFDWSAEDSLFYQRIIFVILTADFYICLIFCIHVHSGQVYSQFVGVGDIVLVT